MKVHSYISPDAFSRRDASDLTEARLSRDSGDRLLRVAPSLEPRDETVFWLTAAAEIEHFLMVHYLFAAYSLAPESAGASKQDVETLQRSLLQIAREEMGHLITVQNLLILVGAPLHFGREHSPFASEIYPFRFRLERVSLNSLAKYAMAESPIDREALVAGMSAEDLELYDTEIARRAKASNDGRPMRHVGPIFARLRELFGAELKEGDLHLDRTGRQALWSDWGYRPNPIDGIETDLTVLVHRFDQGTFEDARDAAVEAIQHIGAQGEEADIGIGAGESHFERFFAAYKAFARIQEQLGTPPVWPVVANPNVTFSTAPGRSRPMVDAMLDSPMAQGRIKNPRTNAWGQLFNLRYRLLLRCLNHALLLDGPVFVESGQQLGDRTEKGLITYWTFKEMRRLKKIAAKLVQLPIGEPGTQPHAGPPFELPYRLDLPADDSDRWRGHADVFRAAARLATEIGKSGTDRNDPFLATLATDDDKSAAIAADLAGSTDLMPDPNDTDFRKVVQILDEAVRGFPVGDPHHAFWRDKTRDQFLATGIADIQIGNPDGTRLVQRIELDEDHLARMPRYRPRIDQGRIDYIRNWIANGAPDNTPAGQIGAPAEPDPRAERVDVVDGLPSSPLAIQAPGFAEHIRPLFRDVPDRTSMLFLFDLHQYEDVRENAAAILRALQDGTMPCTGRWPDEQILLFRSWIAADFPT